jgi:hypothetical protein
MQIAQTSGILADLVERSIEVSLLVLNDVLGIAEDMLPDLEGE